MPEIGAPHKLTHQDGGNDEISVEGLAGDLADAQESTWARVSGKPTTFDPIAHKTSHQDAGSDEISVLGLSGLLGDSQTPLAHKTSHQDGGADEISVAELAGSHIWIPYNAKIADITHADTSTHLINLGTALSESRKIVMAILGALRISGTGALYSYPNSGANHLWLNLNWNMVPIIIADGSQQYKYSLSVSNDDWDLYCFGYVVVVV